MLERVLLLLLLFGLVLIQNLFIYFNAEIIFFTRNRTYLQELLTENIFNVHVFNIFITVRAVRVLHSFFLSR